ncbi:MAG: RNA pyrophosphohydrolase [Proteobacteria bacterium]|nr:RNA pyrophosphohydrolase [Pseudomonadota bacterium]
MIKNAEKPDYLYRSGVGIMLINSDKKIFVGKRIDNNSDAWQMPQGGIDPSENEDVAMFRELKEETGISDSGINIIKKSAEYFYYNLPYKLQKKFWGGKYLGQKQRWYLAEFIGDEAMINLRGESPEFSDWKWIEKDRLINSIVGFKRSLYRDIIKEFAEFL